MRAPPPTPGMAKPEPTPRSSLALRQIALLEGLSDARLGLLAQQCLWHSVEAGKPLLLRAEQQGEVFLLVSGRVRVTTYSANGRQVTFRDSEAGEHFGDIAAIDGGPRSADVVTLEPSVVASLDRPAFMALLRDEPLVAERVMQRLASLVRQLSERVIDLSTLGVQNRLHAELLRLARAAGIDGNQARLDPAPKHAALASQISTNREQVTRELNVLVRGGVLRKDGKALLVADAARLALMVSQVRGDDAGN
ncbi:cyclic nucleotide-binding protein [Variovorax sp. KBW07]|uniref:Crp/Fnr family transcriptional regulator n=1 Tax=Variovorax sp. KBW07 TaxID=2153358 RepID=UPI000F570129|nr:Crp/Fnr family transcriptional regulator [Variovorax sp. KBW07]RQO45593.1 cyclic nucleotide-binding protein [Variovorax sp. KBW07]